MSCNRALQTDVHHAFETSPPTSRTTSSPGDWDCGTQAPPTFRARRLRPTVRSIELRDSSFLDAAPRRPTRRRKGSFRTPPLGLYHGGVRLAPSVILGRLRPPSLTAGTRVAAPSRACGLSRTRCNRHRHVEWGPIAGKHARPEDELSTARCRAVLEHATHKSHHGRPRCG